MQWAFFEDWQFANGSSPCSARYFPEMPVRADAPLVQTLTSGPDTDTYAIEQFVFAAIAQAQKRILVTTPYFVPNEGLLRVLTTAAMRGVDVRLLVPKRGDLLLVAAAGRSYYEELARFGVRIYEYGPAMLHAKTLIIDDDISMVGTANMDNRSFRLNFEIAAVFFDRGIAASLKSHFREDMRSASRYRMRDARREPFFRRLFESIARLLSPLL
jgi:cardiolipin synthase